MTSIRASAACLFAASLCAFGTAQAAASQGQSSDQSALKREYRRPAPAPIANQALADLITLMEQDQLDLVAFMETLTGAAEEARANR